MYSQLIWHEGVLEYSIAYEECMTLPLTLKGTK